MKKVLLGFSFMLLVQACTDSSSTAKVDAPLKTVPFIYPTLKDTSFLHEYVASIQALQHVEIRPRLTSVITSIHVEEGQRVRKGQLLVQLHNQRYQDELNMATAQVRAAESDLKALELEQANSQSLANKNIVSNAELTVMAAKVEVLKDKVLEAKAQQATAALMLANTEIRAPFDGIIGRMPNKVGSRVDEQSLLTTLSDNQAVFAYFPVSEKEFLQLQRNNGIRAVQSLKLLLADGSLLSSASKVEIVDSAIDPSTGTIALKARFPNPEFLLRHGASAKVLLEQPVKNAMLIPQKATFEVQDKTFVYVADEQNTVVLRAIETALRIPHWYVVAEGLKVTDRVLFEGIQNLKVGEVIQLATATSMPNKLSYLGGS
jgi:membrane fusion protein (multidrug efflux system)